MARIAGINLPSNKRIEIALRYIYGIGPKLATDILVAAGVDPNIRVVNLTEPEVNKLRNIINDTYKTESILKRDILLNIKRLRDIGSYKGSRHAKHLPVRGQRTKTNSRTVRGNIRKTVGSGRKPATQKT